MKLTTKTIIELPEWVTDECWVAVDVFHVVTFYSNMPIDMTYELLC